YHHERWDGRGYPEGIAGDDVPLMGRLLAVADAFDAMSSDRSYRPALLRDKVLQEMADCTGTQFDPELAATFLTLDLSEYDRMVQRHRADDVRAA
ncbi:MAG: HD-GYP domain-containing protein, partial [Planctomycetota bacterium]